MVEALGRTRSQAADEHLLNALPSLVGWPVGDAKWPRAGFAPLYRQLYTLVLLDERRTKAMLSALALPFKGLLRLGPDAATYREMIDEIRHALGLNLGSGVIDCLLELAELTVVYPCPRVAAREALWNVILSELIAVAPRLGRLRLDVLRDLAAVLGGAEVVHEIARAAELILTRSDPTNLAG